VCANSLRAGLQKLSGVTNVIVSLNEGTAKLHLKSDQSTIVEQVRRVVEKSGFRPASAEVVVIGQLHRSQTNLALRIFSRKEYALTSSPAEPSKFEALQKLPSDTRLRINGHVPEQKQIQIQVRDFHRSSD
jgi:copper chaperone CopZ